MELAQLEDFFVDIGGQFLTSSFDMRQKLKNIKAFVFDWDGVFNDGRKGISSHSDFTEVDSLGTVMLRYGYYRQQKTLPHVAVISGADNASAEMWARREHIDALYSGAKDKEKALLHFCNQQEITPGQVAYLYDDILDIPIAKKAGLRMAVGRLANPLFISYLEQNLLADYISAAQGNEHVVREFCELLLGLMEQHYTTIEGRAQNDASYREFIAEREKNQTQIWKLKGDGFVPKSES